MPFARTSSFGLLQNGLRGLNASQSGMNITAQNTSNVNTEGYTRQRIDVAAIPGGDGMMLGSMLIPGQGVDLTGYQRLRDLLLDNQVRDALSSDGDVTAQQTSYKEIESLFNEPSDLGLRSVLDKFWGNLQDLANDPTSAAARSAVTNQAQSVVDIFHEQATELANISARALTRINSQISDVNSMGAQIAQLTQDIRRSIATGNQPNELEDQRDLLIDKLAALGNVNVVKNPNGNITVDIGGFNLVTNIVANVSTLAGMVGLTSGSLYGLNRIQTVVVPGLQAQSDAIANGLVTSFNAQHAAGFDLAGAAGGAFWVGATAATIGVNPLVAANPNLVAAAGAAGSPGDGDNALLLAGVQKLAGTVGLNSIDGAYSAQVDGLGVLSAGINRRVASSKIVKSDLINRREETSGVSLDEEMSNMVRFQRSYEAASRIISTVDDMLDRLINRTGRVGL